MSAATAEEFLPSATGGPSDQTHPALVEKRVDPATDEPTQPETDLVMPARSLPSDTFALDEEFAALQSDLPVRPTQYVGSRAGGVSASRGDVVIDTTDEADPSLFELPLADAPAVTPHPGY